MFSRVCRSGGASVAGGHRRRTARRGFQLLSRGNRVGPQGTPAEPPVCEGPGAGRPGGPTLHPHGGSPLGLPVSLEAGAPERIAVVRPGWTDAFRAVLWAPSVSVSAGRVWSKSVWPTHSQKAATVTSPRERYIFLDLGAPLDGLGVSSGPQSCGSLGSAGDIQNGPRGVDIPGDGRAIGSCVSLNGLGHHQGAPPACYLARPACRPWLDRLRPSSPGP